MSEKKDLIPAPPAEAALVKRGSLGLKRALQKEKFNPVRQLIRYVYPQLEPEDQARICLQLMSYLYPKFKPQEVRSRSQKKAFQNNIQINLPGQTPNTPPPSADDLLAIATSQEIDE